MIFLFLSVIFMTAIAVPCCYFRLLNPQKRNHFYVENQKPYPKTIELESLDLETSSIVSDDLETVKIEFKSHPLESVKKSSVLQTVKTVSPSPKRVLETVKTVPPSLKTVKTELLSLESSSKTVTPSQETANNVSLALQTTMPVSPALGSAKTVAPTLQTRLHSHEMVKTMAPALETVKAVVRNKLLIRNQTNTFTSNRAASPDPENTMTVSSALGKPQKKFIH